MKKVFLVFAVTPLFLSSCDKEDSVKKIDDGTKIENMSLIIYPSPNNRKTRLSDYECVSGGNGCLDDVVVIGDKPKLLYEGLIDRIAISKVESRNYITDQTDDSGNELWVRLGTEVVNKLRSGVFAIDVFDSPVDPEKKIFIVGDYNTLSQDNFELVLPVKL